MKSHTPSSRDRLIRSVALKPANPAAKTPPQPPQPRKKPAAKPGKRPANVFRGPPVGRSSRSFKTMFILTFLLCGLGLVMVLTSSVVTSLDDVGSAWYHAGRQMVWLCLGVIAAIATIRIDYHTWKKPFFCKGLLLATLLSLLALQVPGLGITVNGSTRWLRIGPMYFQPSELAKLSLILFTASVVARRIGQTHRVKNVLAPTTIVFLLLAGLIVIQPSLGSVLVMSGIFLAMLYMAGVPMKQLSVLSLAGVGAAALFVLGTSYRRARLMAFFDPWEHPYTIGYQTIQAQIGIASGGLTGLGPGNSKAALAHLPYAHSDFIFAIIAEELGLIGASMVIGSFLLMAVTGLRIAREAPDPYGSLLAIGISSWIVFQAFMNIAVAVGLTPTTGVPLPFISYGGSSLLLNLASIGILLNVARQGRSRAP